MALLRCPQCNLPITDTEARTGTCPACTATFQPQESAAPVATTATGVQPAEPRAWPWAVGGIVALFLMIAGLWLFYRPRDLGHPKDSQRADTGQLPTNKPSPSAQNRDEERKTPTTPAVPPKKVEDKTPDSKKALTKKEEAKKEEPKQKDDPQKAVDDVKPVKKKDDKPVIVKVDEPKPVPKVRRPGYAILPFLPDDAIKIDGDLSDWKDMPSVVLTAVERGNPTKPVVARPKEQIAFLAYCSKGLLVAVSVVDTSGALENEPKPAKGTSWPFWDNDALEIFIDTLNLRPRDRGDPNHHQFIALPFGTPIDAGTGGYESKIIKKAWTIVPQPGTGAKAMLRAGQKTPFGWSMELLIPRLALRQGEFKPGNTFGFELQLDTGTNVFYHWACEDPSVRVSMHPNRWGEVLLGGADAIIEVLDSGNKPTKSFVPGQPLTVRLTDLDLILALAKTAPAPRVTLKSKSGDVKTLVLKETAPKSGVYVGSMPTRLSTGVRTEKIFEVEAGESVVIEYVDPFRANGERDVPVQWQFLAETDRGKLGR
jgi:hypothetical protein